MTETELIRFFMQPFPRSKQQLNKPFECDAELLRIGNETWALSMDEFSPEEDRFTDDAPYRLGANLVTATLSDLFAAGAEPRFFMQALTLPSDISSDFLRDLRDGINATLNQAGCVLCGGDLSRGSTWRYCGFAMGPITATQPLTRKLPETKGSLWITGQLGDANLAAWRETPTPAFELRLDEAAAIRKYATGCIDTSSGLLDALWNLHTLNPHLRIDLRTTDLPMASGLTNTMLPQGIPPEAALVGGAGEYELLFATDTTLDAATEMELETRGMTRIAHLSLHDPGLFIHLEAQPARKVDHPPPCPRAAGSMNDYIGAVINYATKFFGST